MEREGNTKDSGRLADIGTVVIAAVAAALVAVFIAVSISAGTLHIVAFFWCALLFGLMVSYLVTQVRKLRNSKGQPRDN